MTKTFSPSFSFSLRGSLLSFAAATALTLSFAGAARAQAVVQGQNPSFTRAVAEAAAAQESVAEFYRTRAYAPLWTGPEDVARRAAFLDALDEASVQGLPVERYDRAGLIHAFRSAVTEGDRGRLEVAMTTAYLAYARDVKSGALVPSKIDPTIVREIVRPEPAALLAGIAGSEPARYLHGLTPRGPEYARLMKEKMRLEAVIAGNLWGAPVPAGALQPGQKGPAVVALRDRLVALGYLGHSASGSYDRALSRAVQRFQVDMGLTADGIASEATIAAINQPPEARLKSVVVALERLRWMGDAPRGSRHIWVNLPDFVARIVDQGRVTFETRAVIGKNVPDQRTPEFSDKMEYMVVNPSWGVPRSIIVKEYLPLLQRNPNAVGHLQVVDSKGRVVPRGAVNFAAYSASSFPFGLRQPPSDGNALGKVKFMFPNPYNIYLHDTPAKNLFANEVRAYSHGCIRLGDPFDFAYTLLSAQSDDPKGLFQSELDGGRESNVTLTNGVPVHLVYFTAWPTAKGGMSYRRDVYGRDAAIFEALTKAGVVLDGVQG